MPGGTANAAWIEMLDAIGAGFNGLTYKGAPIPVVFRFFHEMTGGWYWWGSSCSTSTEYKAAWTYTVEYLRDTASVHSLLYVYAPSKVEPRPP